MGGECERVDVRVVLLCSGLCCGCRSSSAASHSEQDHFTNAADICCRLLCGVWSRIVELCVNSNRGHPATRDGGRLCITVSSGPE